MLQHPPQQHVCFTHWKAGGLCRTQPKWEPGVPKVYPRPKYVPGDSLSVPLESIPSLRGPKLLPSTANDVARYARAPFRLFIPLLASVSSARSDNPR